MAPLTEESGVKNQESGGGGEPGVRPKAPNILRRPEGLGPPRRPAGPVVILSGHNGGPAQDSQLVILSDVPARETRFVILSGHNGGPAQDSQFVILSGG
jgi:hypothetical protein